MPVLLKRAVERRDLVGVAKKGVAVTKLACFAVAG
jgi:hypothetical protein